MSDQHWQELCEAIINEMDPDKLMDLVNQLNNALEQREQSLRYRQNEVGKPEPEAAPFGWSSELWSSICDSPLGRETAHNQPFVRAIRAASTRLFAPNLLIASER